MQKSLFGAPATSLQTEKAPKPPASPRAPLPSLDLLMTTTFVNSLSHGYFKKSDSICGSQRPLSFEYLFKDSDILLENIVVSFL